MRLFYAIDIPESSKDMLCDYSRKYAGISGIKVLHRELLHITLLFLGETGHDELEKLDRHARNLAEKDFATSITLDKSGVFPNKVKPRIIWVGSKSANEKIICLSDSMNKSYSHYLSKQKPNYYITHITVCRIRNTGKKIEIFEFDNEINIDIEGFSLYESILTPKGPEYKELERYKFNKE